jgi:hypothetical protein
MGATWVRWRGRPPVAYVMLVLLAAVTLSLNLGFGAEAAETARHHGWL